LLQLNDGDFKRQLDRYKYPERYPDETAPRDAARSRAVQTLLLPLEQRLQSQPYLGGETPCATDFAIFPFIRQFAAVAPAWFEARELPSLKAWMAVWLGSDLFALCMAKLPAQRAVAFPALAG
jgi:glutathione S-transferase